MRTLQRDSGLQKHSGESGTCRSSDCARLSVTFTIPSNKSHVISSQSITCSHPTSILTKAALFTSSSSLLLVLTHTCLLHSSFHSSSHLTRAKSMADILQVNCCYCWNYNTICWYFHQFVGISRCLHFRPLWSKAKAGRQSNKESSINGWVLYVNISVQNECFYHFWTCMCYLCSFRFYASDSQASPVHERPQHLWTQTAELVD